MQPSVLQFYNKRRTKQDIHRRSGAYREGLVQARVEGAAALEAAIKVC